MAKGDKVACRVCGAFRVQGGNRPIEYCSTACGDFMKYQNAMVNALDKIDKRLKGKYRKAVKSRMFEIRNSL